MEEKISNYNELIDILKKQNIIEKDILTEKELLFIIQKFSEHIGIIQNKL